MITSKHSQSGLCVQLSVIFGYLWATGDLLLRKRLLMLLHQQKATLTTVRAHLSVLYAEIIQQVEVRIYCRAYDLVGIVVQTV